MKQFLEAVNNGSIEPDHELIRQISTVCHNLPTATSETFREELTTEFNETLMMGYLAAVTTGCTVSGEIIEKLHVSSDTGRKSTRAPI